MSFVPLFAGFKHPGGLRNWSSAINASTNEKASTSISSPRRVEIARCLQAISHATQAKGLCSYSKRKHFWHLHALPSYRPKGEGSEAVETTDFTEDGPLFKVLEFCLSSPSLAPSKF